MNRPLLPGLLLLSVALTGCARERPLAPTEMTDIVRYMFKHWEEVDHLEEGLANLAVWLEDHVPSKEAEDGFRLDVLTRDDISTVNSPERSLEGLLGAAGGADSAFPLEEHAGHMILEDQIFSNPRQYKRYDREVLDGDVAAFLQGEGLIRTSNAVETSTLNVTVPYVLLKDYRWVENREGDRAIIARSWVEERGCSNNGNNCLEHSYSIDHFGARGGQTVRFTATWSEVSSGLPLGDDLLIASLANGLQNVFEATDAWLEEQR